LDKIRLGFVPAHRVPFNEDWAAQMRKRCLKVFAKIADLEIVVPDESLTDRGFVRNDAEADKVIRFFRQQEIQGLIIGAMTFGDEVAALAVAQAFREKPAFLFGTKEAEITPEGLRSSDSFCGTLSISSGLHRREIPFVFGGIVFPEEKKFQQSVLDFMGTCSVVNGFIGANIGLVGPRPERFETCMYNEDAMIRLFRQRVVPTGLVDIMQRAAGAKKGAPELTKIAKDMKSQADLSALNPQTIDKLARLEFALQQFVAEKGLSAVGIQCWTAIQEVYGLSPCYVMGRLTDSGVMASCEVDIYGALTMLIQYRASLSKVAPHFIDWTIQHQKFADTLLAWHCGNEFELKPGVVTLCRLQEYKGKFKMLVTKGDIIESKQVNRGSWSWVKVPDLDRLYSTLINEGFVHHASLIHGDYAKTISDACKTMGIEVVTV
jgi:L-fucose isomerase-like protein